MLEHDTWIFVLVPYLKVVHVLLAAGVLAHQVEVFPLQPPPLVPTHEELQVEVLLGHLVAVVNFFTPFSLILLSLLWGGPGLVQHADYHVLRYPVSAHDGTGNVEAACFGVQLLGHDGLTSGEESQVSVVLDNVPSPVGLLVLEASL